MRHAMSSSFSYSRLGFHSEDSGSYSLQKGGVWLSRSFKFLLQQQGSAAQTADGGRKAEEARRDCEENTWLRKSRHKLRIVRRNSAGERSGERRQLTKEEEVEEEEDNSRPRSKSAMEPASRAGCESGGDGGSTQVELRTEGFQATLLWERIVSHLERTVKAGRHTYALRSYDNCFPGHKVVDCLTGYMNSVLPKSVKKSQARLLGQKLLLTRVIEDARKKEKTVFRESRLYRFTGIHFWDPPCEVHGTRSCSTAAAEGGVYRCHSIENISQGCPSTTSSHKRKSASRRNGYMSDSTLASSSLSRRVVQIRSSRGKREAALTAKSQAAHSHLASTQNGLPASYHSQQQQHSSTNRSRLPWFHAADPRDRDSRSKYRTPTITEEPAILRSISPPRASPMTPRSPATDFRIREPRSLLSRGYPVYPERAHSPESSVVSGVSGYSLDSSHGSSVQLREISRRPNLHQRLVPRPPVGTMVPPPPPPGLCKGRSPAGEGRQTHEQDPNWVVYGYV